MRLALIVVGLVSWSVAQAAPPAPAQSPHADALWERAAARTREIAGQLDGVLAVSVRDLRDGRSFALRGTIDVPAASTIKVAILLALHQQAERGALSLAAPVTLRKGSMVGDDGLLSHLGDGTTTMSVGDLAAAMILLSENSATNLLLDRLGLPVVNDALRTAGLVRTVLRRRMLDRGAAQRGLENTTTPEELLRLWSQLHSGLGGPSTAPLLSAAGTRAVLQLLRVPDKAGALLQRGVPAGTPLWSKPGSLEGVRADCGVIEAPGRPYALCAFATLLGDEAAGEDAIAAVSRAWFSVFQRLGQASPYGRLLGPPAN